MNGPLENTPWAVLDFYFSGNRRRVVRSYLGDVIGQGMQHDNVKVITHNQNEPPIRFVEFAWPGKKLAVSSAVVGTTFGD